jgi:phosphate transport system permease protein
LGSIPFFQAYPSGAGIFTAGIILAIMITPTISAISREVFRAIPNSQREAALGIGATKWEMIKIAVIKSSKAGVFGAIILGLGRALGETMAVTMVIGNRIEIPKTIFSPAQTMASIIANEYSEATNTLHVSALAEIGFVLFGVTFLVNAVARLIIWRVAAK